MVSTVIYYVVRPSIYFSPSKFFLIVLAQKFQCLICFSNSNSFQVFSYSLMMDGCILDGLISNTQQYIDLLDSRCGDHISWIWGSGKNNKNIFHSFSSLLTQKANWNTKFWSIRKTQIESLHGIMGLILIMVFFFFFKLLRVHVHFQKFHKRPMKERKEGK